MYDQRPRRIQIPHQQKDAPFELGEALPLADACACLRAHRRLADHDKINRVLGVEPDRCTVLCDALGVSQVVNDARLWEVVGHRDRREETGA